MYVQSGGALVRKGVEFVNPDGSTVDWSGSGLFDSILGDRWSTYGAIYRSQVVVASLVKKLANAQARLPLPVYRRREDGGREPAPDHPYARLLRNPCSFMDPYAFYRWTVATKEVYGAAAWGKLRDAGGRPVDLAPLHPSSLKRDRYESGKPRTWTFDNGRVRLEGIPDSDIVYFHEYNPDDPTAGLSPMEQLRSTLENEDYARRATSSFWRSGARPGTYLRHPNQLSEPAAKRLVKQWNELAAGADKTGRTIVLEEGMTAEAAAVNLEEAQYIETRRLNREEVCMAFDVPPPVVQILDRATFSNITEQMRSMYRDTMAPRLGYFESVLEARLRSSVRPGASEPDFGDDVYAEYLLDEVLRGAFEVRAAALTQLIGSGQMTPNEARRIENRPPVTGGDTLFVNSAMVPIERATAAPAAAAAGPAKKPDEMPAPLPTERNYSKLPVAVVRTVMGRLSRPASPHDVHERDLVDGLNGHSELVLRVLQDARTANDDMPALRDRIRALTEETA